MTTEVVDSGSPGASTRPNAVQMPRKPDRNS